MNSIRARQDRLLAWLKAAAPDVLCLQELKCVDEKFPALELQAAGYHCACFGQKTYNGVAILSREPLTDVVRGIPDDVEDPQARAIAASVRGVRVVSVYAPNGQAVDSPAYQYKLEWYGRLRRYLDTHLKPADPVAACGDFNVAPEPIDVHDPKLWDGQTLFSLPERAALKQLMGFGLADAFRRHHAEGELVGLPDARVPQEPRAAHRPRARERAADRTLPGGGHRPRSAQGRRSRIGWIPATARPPKMLSQAALCLAHDELEAEGGVLTPATAMGLLLVERLRQDGPIFEVSA